MPAKVRDYPHERLNEKMNVTATATAMARATTRTSSSGREL